MRVPIEADQIGEVGGGDSEDGGGERRRRRREEEEDEIFNGAGSTHLPRHVPMIQSTLPEDDISTQ